MLEGMKGFKAAVVHVIREPEEDEFPAEGEKEKWYHAHRKHVERMLEAYRRMLIDAGFTAEDVSIRETVRYCPSMADSILAERDVL
jgi:hypothetical protein